ATMLLPPLRRLTNVNANLQKGVAAGESIFELVDLDDEKRHLGEPIDVVHGELAFEHVSFSYAPGKESVLRELSFRAEPGETVAPVGRSGSGKSTLAGLVPRFYDVSDGAIRLDGRDIREVRLSDLRRNIAMVSQEVILFNNTIAHNIA